MSMSNTASVSLESLLEVDCWGSNTTVGNTVNIYTPTPISQQNMTRIQGTTETLSDISELSSILQSEQPTDNRVSELSSIIQSEQLADNNDLLEKVKEKVGLRV